MEARRRLRAARPLVAARRARRALRLALPSDDPEVARQLADALARLSRPHPALVALFVLTVRRVRGLSAAQAARALGVSRRTFLSWERGRLPRLSPEVRRGVRVLVCQTGGEGMERVLREAGLAPPAAPTWAQSMELRVRAALAAVRARDPGALASPEEWAIVGADALGLTRADVCSTRRTTRLVLARRSIAAVMLAEGFTKTDIGRALHRHHSTVAYYVEGQA